MIPECRFCAERLDHCHGTLIKHVSGRTDCTDPGCDDVDVVRHDLIVDCDLVFGECDCLTASVLSLAV